MSENEIITKALEKGIIGATLGALFTGKSKVALASLIAGIAIGASFKAFKQAKKTNIPVLYEDNGSIYRLYSNGKLEFVKKIESNNTNIPERFSLG